MGSLLDQIRSTARPTKATVAKTTKTKSKKTTAVSKGKFQKATKQGKTGKPRAATRIKGAPALRRR